ncbi:MAG: nucleotidyl transferase AbiEii/AbiGii toxin family protein [Bacteroidales bacterium]|nr:nucleotidyl transferase AbiEii/AbiGii toxin family protein [Bacteroidales bacterium]
MSDQPIMPLSSDELRSIVDNFIKAANENHLKMILIGGGAVNFHGVQRHSADIDFWIDTQRENLDKLKLVLKQLNYRFDDFPKEVYEQKQNISIHISPVFKIELITCLNFGISFSEAYEKSDVTFLNDQKILELHILSYDDLIESKLKAGRPKDYYDVLSLREIDEKRRKEE